MVGICGAVGRDGDGTEALAGGIYQHEGEETAVYEDEGLSFWGSFHPLFSTEPATANGGDVRLWVWGDVYGYDTGDVYDARDDTRDAARYCAELYETHGMGFASGLNGDFTIVVYERDEESLSFVTDRVATRPVFTARPSDEALLFASNVQALAHHPDVDPELDLPLLYEYLELRRVFGVETPLAGVSEVPPASVVTVDLEDLSTTTTTYWRPHYEPVDKSVGTIVTELAERFQQVFAEWTRDDLDYGVLVSGGSDSRAVLAGIDQDVDAFHISDWESRETRVAEHAASTAGADFHLLEREPEADADILGQSPAMANFSGWFDQAYFAGFEDTIRDEVDVLLSGLYADMLFGGGPLEKRALSLGPLGNVSLPTSKSVRSVDQYVDVQTSEAIEPLPYLTESFDIADVLRARIECDDGSLVSHGVRYNSIEDLVMYSDYYPMSADTDAIFSRSLMHLLPYRTPFFDNRLLDLQQQIPRTALLRRNLIHKMVDQIDEGLADIPHAQTGIPLKYPFAVDYIGGNINQFQWKHLLDDIPEPYLDHGPWPNRQEVIRHDDFAVETIEDHESTLESLPFLDYEGALDCYQDHLEGANNTTILYSLLTLLEMPLTDRLVEGELGDDVAHGPGGGSPALTDGTARRSN